MDSAVGQRVELLSRENEALPQLNSSKNSVSGVSLAKELFAGAAWCVCSFSMILTNKFLVSCFNFKAPMSLLFFQFISTVLLIDIATGLNIIKRDALDWRIVKIWWPLNMIFVGMIGTGFYALKTLQVPMVTLLKNLTNLLTIVGDLYFFGKRYSIGVWASLALMALSAGVGSMTDLSFTPWGYTWQLLNCLCTAGYALYLKRVLNSIQEATAESNVKMSDITKVYYNHLLGLPWLLLLMVVFGEQQILMAQPAIHNPAFVAALLFSGVVGFAVSFTSIQFMAMSTATTFSMVGSLNKIPTAILGWILFNAKTTVVNVASVLVGICAGIVFIRAKAQQQS